MAKKTKSSPSSSFKSQPDEEPHSKKPKKIKQQENTHKHNQELQEPCENEALKRETLKELLQPFSKDQIIEFLKFAIFEDRELVSRITHFSDSDPAHRKLFVHGLAWETTSEQVLSIFAQFGDIEECSVPLDNASGRAKGFAFVLYKTREGAENALKERQKKIGNRVIYCQLASDGPIGGNSGGEGGGSGSGSGRKIFVANVGPHVDPEMLKLFFEKFGELEEGPSGMDSVSGKFRGYCFFVYKSGEGCKKALEEPIKMFENCRLECRLATENFKNSKNQTRVLNNVAAGFGGSPSSDIGGNGNYNAGVNPGFYVNPGGMGHNPGFGLANPMMVPSLNQNGLATSIGANPQTIGFGGNYGINSVSPSGIGSYASLYGLGGYQAQVGNSFAVSTVGTRSQSGHQSTAQPYPSHFHL
ncbi:UBP1-associated protein 2A [Heracleum sosnowskyi]|uniref:UBP1-associated protein 2A n=1 Tax=Heracleum sosnowskyi TaxID=360622 RepID=A0AAD8IYM2_9APIA|nr:UBP1-associated protein 2A [Heracleum sosnowskyi]